LAAGVDYCRRHSAVYSHDDADNEEKRAAV